MTRPTRTRATAVGATGIAAALTLAGLGALPALADEAPEQIVNGGFDSGTAPWWWTPTTEGAVVDGRLCADVPAGTLNAWDVIIGQDDVPLVAGESYTFGFTASATTDVAVRALIQEPVEPWATQIDERPQLTAEATAFEYVFTASADMEDAQVAFQIGGAEEAWTFCLDDVTLQGGAEPPPPYEPDTGPRVRVNQVGYLPDGPKGATVVTEATEALPWELADASGAVVAEGQTVPQGVDPSSAQNVHTIDFSAYTTPGEGYTLTADGETSHPFDLSGEAYQDLRVDSLSFYYPQRSGIEIDDAIAPGYGRPAGHVGVAPNQGDTEVPCAPGSGCDYSLDVSGGWYDAGDHGKYVVNGGISAAQLMGIYERSTHAPTADEGALDDGTLRLPETGNDVPDVLDEARWEMEFLLSMQVPDGEPLAGMAHHKMHDAEWTGLPLLPHEDPQPRYLQPPSTAATLNLAAAGAQCARVFEPFDAGFAAECLSAAEEAWAAAVANPDVIAPNTGVGGGAYSDPNVEDEFYWAAAELFLATGAQEYQDAVTDSPLHTDPDIFRPEGFDWGWTAPLGRLDLATVDSELPGRDQVRASVLAAADDYLATVAAHPYGSPYAPSDGVYAWGSNNLLLNNLVVVATAFDISGEEEYRDGVLAGVDYVFGRNALNQSYVTGYGENAAENQHSRWYANQLDASLPNPPAGTLSGGPNSQTGTWDPVAQENLAGCAPQFCYIDDIGSWATNELTINWNAPLAWVTSFVADQVDEDGGPVDPPTGACTVAYAAQTWPGGFTAQVRVENTGDEPVDGWTVGWTWPGTQRFGHGWNARFTHDGASVTASNLDWNRRIAPGGSISFGLNGTATGTAHPVPESFTLNGVRCE
ncbi:glycoside hydrolase family 9 protein [Allonocardiopsis opalescens]|uniref:Endoglucanase n=1 Tax=Allonocardiopsis opalescens TaxID=1144618 RepID=A0A2T0Q0I4_9ACTN|nr:glycoside hydrolase family 9 protein [Allonocardiopsis opalescens]PRX97294.1 non-processive endocellulase [Allonocardiopsis opalescens]